MCCTTTTSLTPEERRGFQINEALLLEAQMRKERHIIVHHNYHDRANEPAPQEDLLSESLVAACKHNTFPYKLYSMLERVEDEGLSHIVSWQPHGRCFVVHQPKEFRDLLYHYFNVSKISSFQRQLNLYGFSRLTKGLDRGGYYHELFLRGRPFLLARMRRQKVKGTFQRARSNPEEEPNFYGMTTVGPNCSPATVILSTEDEMLSQACDQENEFQSSLQEQDEDDVVYSWSGQKFHYIDSSSIPDKVGSEAQHTPIDDELTDLFDDDALQAACCELLEEDLDFPEMLERVVS
jgi:hypothetical protein